MDQSNRRLNPDFIFNNDAYKNSRILITRKTSDVALAESMQRGQSQTMV